MASTSAGDLGRKLNRLFGAGSAVGLTDGELLERFAHRRDEAAEAAFESILARHGAMVLTVCRQVLGDAHAAEDAFQATFLIMLRRAGSLRVRKPGSLGPWLHGVAYRIALEGPTGDRPAPARELRAAMPTVGGPSAALEQDELHALLHEEVNRLPAKYRAPVVLCYFEGRTHDEAAAALQWPVGTVRGRLARARDLLRARLTRRGQAPSGWVGATLLEPIARLEPPPELLEATVAATIKGMPATAVGAMASRMLRSLLLARLGVTAGVLAMALMMAGFGLALRGALASQARQQSETTPRADTTARIVSKPIDRRADPLPEHAPIKELPPRVARLLRWLPEDTETLIVARSVSLLERLPDKPRDANWLDFGVGLATGDLDLVEEGKAAERLRGRKIECVVNGARNFRAVGTPGSLCSESCAIIVFEKNLGNAAREWTESLRKRATAVRTLVGREVFVFPPMTARCPGSTYLVLLGRDTVLYATGYRYLESVLRRADEVPASRALPDDLPEWKQVDLDAPVWMLRHIPEAAGKTRALGVTATITRDAFRVTYIPRVGSDFNIQDISKQWLPASLFQTPAAREKLKIVRHPEGTVVVSSRARPDDETVWLGWQLYFLQAFERFDRGE